MEVVYKKIEQVEETYPFCASRQRGFVVPLWAKALLMQKDAIKNFDLCMEYMNNHPAVLEKVPEHML